ncbi:hypothetical protein AXX17_AT1G34890 [Arabidopsis thaliana]|uniref:Uncharacterized protein n=1 Tax=Arabidopsis thaliana TaxID=3702 RepID=A0A178W413_ARATH|nr:hypothetical protein AXX17_AT1G34890 [Arabidopsis thaliana]
MEKNIVDQFFFISQYDITTYLFETLFFFNIDFFTCGIIKKKNLYRNIRSLSLHCTHLH